MDSHSIKTRAHHVFQHVRVVPVHTRTFLNVHKGAFWMNSRRFFSARYTTPDIPHTKHKTNATSHGDGQRERERRQRKREETTRGGRKEKEREERTKKKRSHTEWHVHVGVTFFAHFTMKTQFRTLTFHDVCFFRSI